MAFAFLARPGFVIGWYSLGLLAAAFVMLDIVRNNREIPGPMKWAWPILTVFFSVLGAALYLVVGRPWGVERYSTCNRGIVTERHQRNVFVRIVSADAHCVAGDGLGIVTAMVTARLLRMSPWQEFWFEYCIGFALGWVLFQYPSMPRSSATRGEALAKAFGAEFFSMLAVMGGMGAVMLYVTPQIVGMQPSPTTPAFWGFAMLGLFAGFVLGLPMNALMVLLGWKHAEHGIPVERPAPRTAVSLGAVAFGAAALTLPAWLNQQLERRSIMGGVDTDAAAVSRASIRDLERGFVSSTETAVDALVGDDRARSARAVDGALRVAEVGATVAPTSMFPLARDLVRGARRAVQGAREDVAIALLQAARSLVVSTGPDPLSHSSYGRATSFEGAMVVDANGSRIGEVRRVERGAVYLAIGGLRDVWGFVDLTSGRPLIVPHEALFFGPDRALGRSW